MAAIRIVGQIDLQERRGHQSPKFYDTVFLFVVGLTTLGTYIVFDQLSVQTFHPLSVKYRRGNFVYHHWECSSIYWPLPYPFRSMYCLFAQISTIFLLLENCKQNFGEKKCKIVFFAAVLSISFFPLIVRELEVTSLM